MWFPHATARPDGHRLALGLPTACRRAGGPMGCRCSAGRVSPLDSLYMRRRSNHPSQPKIPHLTVCSLFRKRLVATSRVSTSDRSWWTVSTPSRWAA